jgi:hypothetical protein
MIDQRERKTVGNIINCWETIGLRGVIKVVRKLKGVGVVCVVVEVKGPTVQQRERVGIALVCLRTSNRRQRFWDGVSEH